MAAGRKNGEIIKKLWDERSHDECWPWLGNKNKRTGYGKKQWFGRSVLAHRWMYEQRVGEIPPGKVINHKCSNRACVNPDHLEVVSQALNVRHGAGTRLTWDDVAVIRAANDNRKWGDGAKLARRFNVSSALIHDIWNGRTWKECGNG